jgi:acyl-CoA thioester hydrolase
MPTNKVNPELSAFPITRSIQTRWSDNDHYGHVNNAVYYMYLDTAVNGWLMEATGLDTRDLSSIGIVVSSRCEYLVPVGFPDRLQVGLATSRVGNSSVTYQLAVFREPDETLCAVAEFIHVYVDRTTRRPTSIPESVRSAVSILPTISLFN